MRRVGTCMQLVLLLVIAAAPGRAQENSQDAQRRAEAERKEIFRAGFAEIVNDLNRNSTDRFINAIDQEDMIERVFALRLIDPKIKKAFREDFPDFVAATFAAPKTASEDVYQMRVSWLGFGSSGNKGKAIVRQDLPGFQFNYYEYELRLDGNGSVRIVDFIDFMAGESFSASTGEQLVRLSPGKNAVRKMLDFQNVTEPQLFQITELLKAARDMQADRFFKIYGDMDEQLQSQRIAILSGVHLCKSVGDRRKLRVILESLAEYFPDEPLYSLMLLDYYFPTRRYELALDTLLRLQKRLNVPDSAMSARLSAATLVLDDIDAAVAHADEAVRLEPGLELGWWSALRSRAAAGQYGRAVEALDVLEQQFGYSLGPDAFEKDPSMAPMLATDEYEAWLSERE